MIKHTEVFTFLSRENETFPVTSSTTKPLSSSNSAESWSKPGFALSNLKNKVNS